MTKVPYGKGKFLKYEQFIKHGKMNNLFQSLPNQMNIGKINQKWKMFKILDSNSKITFLGTKLHFSVNFFLHFYEGYLRSCQIYMVELFRENN